VVLVLGGVGVPVGVGVGVAWVFFSVCARSQAFTHFIPKVTICFCIFTGIWGICGSGNPLDMGDCCLLRFEATDC
jgi:hypothetical protein